MDGKFPYHVKRKIINAEEIFNVHAIFTKLYGDFMIQILKSTWEKFVKASNLLCTFESFSMTNIKREKSLKK